MMKSLLTGGKSLWHYFKYICSACYRQQIKNELAKKELMVKEIAKKNIYLEHAAKILRHDMHSGINTYIPRGLSSLKRRLPEEIIKEYKLESAIRLLSDGLEHAQTVYKGVYEFTNLVRPDAELTRERVNLSTLLNDYLKNTAYKNQVVLSELPEIDINPPLFCTALDNLIRNGLKYNDSDTKKIEIFYSKKTHDLFVEDNGRGLSSEALEKLKKPYLRDQTQQESGSGLGLNIALSIFDEHGFKVNCEELPSPYTGTRFHIDLGNLSDYKI